MFFENPNISGEIEHGLVGEPIMTDFDRSQLRRRAARDDKQWYEKREKRD
jgi:hypothetical protein